MIGDFPMVRCEGCRSLIAQTERAMRKHYGECAGAMRLRLDQLQRKARRTNDEVREMASLRAALEALKPRHGGALVVHP